MLTRPEEFLASLSMANRLIYRRRKTKNLHRSWILFCKHILVIVQNDNYQPWLELDSILKFRLPFNRFGLVCYNSLAEFISFLGSNNFAFTFF
jgi:hypothetical protein